MHTKPSKGLSSSTALDTSSVALRHKSPLTYCLTRHDETLLTERGDHLQLMAMDLRETILSFAVARIGSGGHA